MTARSGHAATRDRDAATVAIGLAAHLTFARLATAWSFDDTDVNVLWPATGVTIGLALVVRDRWWWVVVGAALGRVVDLVVLDDISTRFLVASLGAQVVEHVVVLLLATRLFDPPEILRTTERTMRYVVGGTILATSCGAAVLVAIGSFDDRVGAVRDWMVGDGAGILLGVPTAYGIGRRLGPRFPLRSRCTIELAVTIVAVGSLSAWAFSTDDPVAFLVVPALGWIAVRFGLIVSAPAGLLIAMWATWRTSEGDGPFASLDDAVLSAQLFTIAVAVTGTVIGTQATESDRRRRRLGGIIASVPDAVLVIDEHGIVREDFTGDAEGDGARVGSHDVDLVVGDDVDRVVTARAEWIELGSARVTAERLDPTTGRRIAYEASFRRIDGHQAIAVGRDVTHLLAARSEIQHQARRWRELMNVSFEGIAELDAAGRVVESNDRLASLLGNTSASLNGKLLDELVSDEHRPSWSDDVRRIRAGERVSAWIEISGHSAAVVVLPRLDDHGAFAGALIIALDTSAPT